MKQTYIKPECEVIETANTLLQDISANVDNAAPDNKERIDVNIGDGPTPSEAKRHSWSAWDTWD